MSVTVGIKALNEEDNIAAALISALSAVAPFSGEVILADSGSLDRTIEIASRFPVRIVQLADPAERCCGAGAQLAFQHASHDYFYLLDGDMVLDPLFLSAGVAYLTTHPKVAGVGGHVVERNVIGEDFQIRANAVREGQGWKPGIVDRLDCGGLYRSSAVRETGYFADRNLHAFEEFDLGARLQSLGWELARIDHPAIDHFGHTTGGYSLLWRRLLSGYAGGAGEVLRGAFGRSHLPIVLRRLGHVRTGFAVVGWWLLLLASFSASWRLAVVLILVPLLFLSYRRGSFRLGLYSLAAWNISALGMITGLFRRRVSPTTPLASVELVSGTS